MRRILGITATAVLAASAVPAAAAELVVNGKFTAGNTGFSSDYVDRTGGPTGGLNGSYAIGTDAATVPNSFSDWGGFGDHSTGSGNMLVADGAMGRAWFQTVALVAGTTYDWSFWAHTAQGNSGGPAVLSFEIDGVALSGALGLPLNSGSPWQQLMGSFTAGVTGNAVVSIYDANGAGTYNDFALDDISLVSRVAGGVPEPATWAMLILGFGAVGARLRRRRTSLAFG